MFQRFLFRRSRSHSVSLVRWLSTKDLTKKRPTTPLGMLAWDQREEAARSAGEGISEYEMAESVMERVATRKIREHIESGGFDNLVGKGKKLENYELGADGGLSKMMKNANVLPKWVVEWKDLKRVLHRFRKQSKHERRLEELNDLNVRIKKYNVICQVSTMIIPLLDKKKELNPSKEL